VNNSKDHENMPRNRVLDYAKAEDAAEASNTKRILSSHTIDLFLKGTGNSGSSRGYGAVLLIDSQATASPKRRLLFRGGVKGESLPGATFRGVVECLDILASLGFTGASVVVHTDSPNLLQAIQGLAYRWRERGWKAACGKTTQNADMIARMLDHMDNSFTLEAVYKMPERCHKLRLAETLSLYGHATPEGERLEEVTTLSLVA
jgi:ribonuclease HI